MKQFSILGGNEWRGRKSFSVVSIRYHPRFTVLRTRTPDLPVSGHRPIPQSQPLVRVGPCHNSFMIEW